VPIEIAGAGGGVLTEPERRADGAPRPGAREPEDEAGDREEGEGEIGEAVDQFAARAGGLAAEAEVAVPTDHGLHERGGGAGAGFAEFAGVRIKVIRTAAGGEEGDGGGRIALDDERGGAGVGLRGAEAGLELGEGEAERGGGGRGDGAGIAFGPGDELFLEGEGGAGETQEADQGAADEAGGEVEPKENGAKRHEKRRERAQGAVVPGLTRRAEHRFGPPERNGGGRKNQACRATRKRPRMARARKATRRNFVSSVRRCGGASMAAAAVGRLEFVGGAEVEIAAGGGVDAVGADAGVVVFVEEVVQAAAMRRSGNPGTRHSAVRSQTAEAGTWRWAVLLSSAKLSAERVPVRASLRAAPRVKARPVRTTWRGAYCGVRTAAGALGELGVEEESVGEDVERGAIAAGGGGRGAAGEEVVADGEFGAAVDGAADVGDGGEAAGERGAADLVVERELEEAGVEDEAGGGLGAVAELDLHGAALGEVGVDDGGGGIGDGVGEDEGAVALGGVEDKELSVESERVERRLGPRS
jgi:hypothetical protein